MNIALDYYYIAYLFALIEYFHILLLSLLFHLSSYKSKRSCPVIFSLKSFIYLYLLTDSYMKLCITSWTWNNSQRTFLLRKTISMIRKLSLKNIKGILPRFGGIFILYEDDNLRCVKRHMSVVDHTQLIQSDPSRSMGKTKC